MTPERIAELEERFVGTEGWYAVNEMALALKRLTKENARLRSGIDGLAEASNAADELAGELQRDHLSATAAAVLAIKDKIDVAIRARGE